LESKGIYSTTLNLQTGVLSNPEFEIAADNPAYLCVHPSANYLYAVNELENYENTNSGAVTAYFIESEASPKLKQIQQTSSHGATTCHISVDKSGKSVLLTNYNGATVATFPIKNDGSLSPSPCIIHCEGSGPHPSRQERSHPHSVNLDPIENTYCFVTDLGSDSLNIYKFDEKNASLQYLSKIQVKPGSGPRQLVWHPSNNYVYVVNELDSTINAYKYQNGTLNEIARLDINPPEYAGKKWSAEIQVHPNGKFLYATNRIADSFAICSIDGEGRLSVVGHHPTNGFTPRTFVIDPSGTFLLVANQHSDNITSFKIDQHSGNLTKISEVHVSSPSCLKFLQRI